MAVKRFRPANKTMINFINKILAKIFGSSGDRVKKELQPVVEEVNSFEESTRALDDETLAGKTEEFRGLPGGIPPGSADGHRYADAPF